MGYQIIRALLYFFFSLYGLHVEGRENIPDKGAVIAAANHKSYFDPPLVGIAMEKRRISFMAKSELFRNPLFGRLIRYLGAFPVKRNSADMTAIRKSLAELKKGQVLCIFRKAVLSMERHWAVFIRAWRSWPSSPAHPSFR